MRGIQKSCHFFRAAALYGIQSEKRHSRYSRNCRFAEPAPLGRLRESASPLLQRHKQLRLVAGVVFANVGAVGPAVRIRSHDELRLAGIAGKPVQIAAILVGDHCFDSPTDGAFGGDPSSRLNAFGLLHGRDRHVNFVRPRPRHRWGDDAYGQKSAEECSDD